MSIRSDRNAATIMAGGLGAPTDYDCPSGRTPAAFFSGRVAGDGEMVQFQLKWQVQLEKELFSVAGGVLWNTVIASIAQANLGKLKREVLPHEA